ncbi:hypothetical protein HIM_09910 [Hirsutella minnesotensis 3608]|uniref:ferric-chelate reductase (NADPH) n=1 Tax=Hirsutella minnesotensis 3608 TaxID=1043627 RepID=A0A0F7ZGD2_9HYPO|nr:hypothetical protein HIM_09910 [Hirsutella minnesotensis 3608]
MESRVLTEATNVYGLSLAGAILLLTLVRNLRPRLLDLGPGGPLRLAGVKVLPPVLVYLLHYRRYVFFSSRRSFVKFFRRNGLLSPWKLQEIVLALVYVGANVACVGGGGPELAAASLRAGRLAVVNLVIPLAGPHLSFLADVVKVSLHMYKRIHAASGALVLGLALFHAISQASLGETLPVNETKYIWGFVAIVLMCFQSILFPVARRFLWFEIVLRGHQINAVIMIYALCRHTPHFRVLVYFVIAASLFTALSLAQAYVVLDRHRFRTTYAIVTHREDTVHVMIKLNRALRVEPGQYLNIWMPLIAIRSAFQTHPFAIASWSAQPQHQLEIVIAPAEGWTKRLMEMAHMGSTIQVAMFSGPHGPSASIECYEHILVLVQGVKLFSWYPHVSRIMHSCTASESPLKKVHLVFEAASFCELKERSDSGETSTARSRLLSDDNSTRTDNAISEWHRSQ